jgi:hypothetical protein
MNDKQGQQERICANNTTPHHTTQQHTTHDNSIRYKRPRGRKPEGIIHTYTSVTTIAFYHPRARAR